jgi:hypothetical protein
VLPESYRITVPNRVALAILAVLQPDFGLLTKCDASRVGFHHGGEMLDCVHSARLNHFLSSSLAFASGETTGPGNRMKAPYGLGIIETAWLVL